jgi:acetyl esterase/lipase
MKNLIFFSLVVLISCTKKDVAPDKAIAAQNLSNISYGSDAAQTMDVYLPKGRSEDSTRVFVLVHGGAWVSGDKSDISSFVPALQQRFPGYAIVNINYRLATETANHFPAQENDMKAAVDFLAQKSGDYHISPKFVLLGASAGAHLALLQAYKHDTPEILAAVDFFGPVDLVQLYNLFPSGSFNQLAFEVILNGTPSTNASLFNQSSPVNFVSAQSPPTIIFHGTADDLVPIEQSIKLQEKLSSAGVPNRMVQYQGLGHDVWPATIMNDAFDKIKLFLQEHVR